MKTVGLFEAKAKLSAICERVAEEHEPVTVTRRGRAWVMIVPAESPASGVWEERERYIAEHGQWRDDFELPPRERDVSTFTMADNR